MEVGTALDSLDLILAAIALVATVKSAYSGALRTLWESAQQLNHLSEQQQQLNENFEKMRGRVEKMAEVQVQQATANDMMDEDAVAEDVLNGEHEKYLHNDEFATQYAKQVADQDD